MMQRVIIVGSPRPGGRSAHLAEALMEACIDECPDDGLVVLSVASLDVAGCVGCDGCFQPPKQKATSALPCVIDDDFALVRERLDEADELIIVTPVYFAGVPSQLKAWLDRVQPYFWTDLRHGGAPGAADAEAESNVDAGDAVANDGNRAMRPLTIHIVGEGDDPFGFTGVIASVSSALLCAGFQLERVLSWVGKIDDDGQIIADAEEVAWPRA